ncbi:MAG TPA: branched-chain amino acid ABC transporter permease [Candidatus Methylomirabilis sp.]|nr:branched-chain amino acid ABC transporter permease [Candidatus Methylomirabilis sp.]HSB77252.1 branched-chain amino acid ABC transporter permease [Candidatus Methylomirabilis sp.]
MTWDRDLKIGLVLALVLASLPWWALTGPYYMGIAITALTFVALALAWNIISGIGGQLSMGHGAYFGLGAYTSSLLLVRLGVTPWIGMLAGAIVAALFGLCVGYPSFRLKGVYFKLVTFVAALILEIICRSWSDFTGGDPGLQIPLLRNAPAMYQFGSPVPYFYIILVMAGLYFLLTRRLLRSRFGYYLQALRDDQVAAEVLGVNSLYMKLAGFALSAMLTALVGTFYAQYLLFIDPASTFGMFVSVKIALAAIVGGAGTLWGPVIGGLFLVPVAELSNAQFTGTLTGVDVVLYSVVLILTAIFVPRGVVSLPAFIRSKMRRMERGKAPSPPAG